MTSPSTGGISGVLVGWRDRKGRFGKLDDTAVKQMRGALQSRFRAAVKVAEEESPVDKGTHPGPRFKASWRFTTKPTGDGVEGELTNVAPHAGFVIFPTRPHVIRAKRGKVLAFQVGGKTVFARSVHHPGTKGNDVPGRVLSRLEPDLTSDLQKVAGQVETAIVEIFR